MRLLARVVHHREFEGREVGFRLVEEELRLAVRHLPRLSVRYIPEMDLLHLRIDAERIMSYLR